MYMKHLFLLNQCSRRVWWIVLNLFLIAGYSGSTAATTQNQVTGRVTEKAGLPLRGANVQVKGTTMGVSADEDGRFAIQADGNEAPLVSMIGYATQESPVNSRTVIDVILEADFFGLEEVVVIGYGTTSRQDFTGSVSSLRMEESPVALLPNTNTLEALKGNIPGLDIGATNTAGGQPSMQIRGQNSISGTNDPLIVLDGVIYLGSLNDINPNDIASVDVLKDATSAAAYGSRSANGVIAITTKRGRSDKPMISLNTSTGVQRWQNQPVMMRGEQWIEVVNARNQYSEGSINWLKPGELANREAGRETIWLDEITRTGVMQTYQASVSGAAQRVNYYFSSSYDDNEGVIIGDDFNRVSLLGKLETQIADWLELGLDAAFSRRDYSGIAANVGEAQTMSPYGVMFRDDQGNLEKYPYTQSGVNPLWGVEDGLRDNQDIRNNFRLNARMEVAIPWIDGLSYRVNYLTNLDRNQSANFTYEGFYVQEGEGLERYDPGVIQGFLTNANGNMNNNKTRSYVVDNILNYRRDFDRHVLDVTLVATRDYLKYQMVNSIGSDFASNGNTALGRW